jgi:hypothetical protein
MPLGKFQLKRHRYSSLLFELETAESIDGATVSTRPAPTAAASCKYNSVATYSSRRRPACDLPQTGLWGPRRASNPSSTMRRIVIAGCCWAPDRTIAAATFCNNPAGSGVSSGFP